MFRFYGVMVETSSTASRKQRQRLVDQVLALPWNEQPLILARILGGWEADGQLPYRELERILASELRELAEKTQ